MNIFIKLGILAAGIETGYLITMLILGLTINVPFMLIVAFAGVMAIAVGIGD